jgi:hypothetical protein
MHNDGETEPRFDADLGPTNPHNKEVARRAGLHWDVGKRAFVDGEGSLVLDKFGQPYG